MPNAQILNFMQQGAPPLLTDQRAAIDANQAQANTTIESNMLKNEVTRMGIDQEKKKRSLLETFEGDMMGAEFQQAMMRVDPDLVTKMQTSIAKLSTSQAEAVTGRMEMASKMALADNTPEKWKARGWPQPYEMREEIIMTGASMSEALGREREVYSRSNVKPTKETKSDVEVRLSEWLSDPRNKHRLNTDQGIKYRKWLDELQQTTGNEKIRRQIAAQLDSYESGQPASGSSVPPRPTVTGKPAYQDVFKDLGIGIK